MGEEPKKTSPIVLPCQHELKRMSDDEGVSSHGRT